MKFRHMIFCADCHGEFAPAEFDVHDCVNMRNDKLTADEVRALDDYSIKTGRSFGYMYKHYLEKINQQGRYTLSTDQHLIKELLEYLARLSKENRGLEKELKEKDCNCPFERVETDDMATIKRRGEMLKRSGEVFDKIMNNGCDIEELRKIIIDIGKEFTDAS